MGHTELIITFYQKKKSLSVPNSTAQTEFKKTSDQDDLSSVAPPAWNHKLRSYCSSACYRILNKFGKQS